MAASVKVYGDGQTCITFILHRPSGLVQQQRKQQTVVRIQQKKIMSINNEFHIQRETQ